jgi:hypothetical protein
LHVSVLRTVHRSSFNGQPKASAFEPQRHEGHEEKTSAKSASGRISYFLAFFVSL